MLKRCVSCQDRVVRLHYRSRNLRRRVDTEFQLALLSVIDRQPFHEQSAESRTGASSKRMEDKETLETGTVVCNTPDFVQHLIDKLLANGIVAACIVV